MDGSGINSFGMNLQKLTDYVEEIVKGSDVTTRGAGSAAKGSSEDPIPEWIQRVYPYTNETKQEFHITVRTPNLAENQDAFHEFCNTLAFFGECIAKNSSNSSLYNNDAPKLVESTLEDTTFQIEIDFEVVNTNGLISPYTVNFEFDPTISVFIRGETAILHTIPKDGPKATGIQIDVRSQHGEFDASLTPPFPLPGESLIPKHVFQAGSVPFSDFSGTGTRYQLELRLHPGDRYEISGSYEI